MELRRLACYNPDWLEKLEEWEIELLEVNEEDYDFSLEDKQPDRPSEQLLPVAGPSSH